MVLTASAPALMPLEEVQAAFVQRSKALVAGRFRGRLSAADGKQRSAEIEALIRLAENVAGGVNKRAAARWIVSAVGSPSGLKRKCAAPPARPPHASPPSPTLERGVRKAGLSETEQLTRSQAVLANVGAIIEADSKLVWP